MADPLGRKHTTIHKPKNRHQIDRVCDYVLFAKRKDFAKKPSADHVYFDAYSVIYGTDEAYKMLTKAKEK
jgi:glutaredoxin